jgi:predicted phosphodiesterase
MRYAVLSDIHSNLPALERVLAEAEKLGVDGYLCAGDLVGYGGQPNECCDLLRALNVIMVRGNHDEAAVEPGKEMWFTSAARTAILWTRAELTGENLGFIEGLPKMREVEGAQICHGSLPDPDLYTNSPAEAQETFLMMTQPLCIIGHTHYSEWYIDRGDHRLPTLDTRPQGGDLVMAAGRRYILNPGAVGQPRDGNSQASFATWDVESAKIQIVRVSYDIPRAQQHIIEADLPLTMAERLQYGV